ncbi:MAG TPA: hypothetical protein PKM50_08830, partial [Methanoregula sp.]|nr:hypothetical protein [Methanoregula sp.]
ALACNAASGIFVVACGVFADGVRPEYLDFCFVEIPTLIIMLGCVIIYSVVKGSSSVEIM